MTERESIKSLINSALEKYTIELKKLKKIPENDKTKLTRDSIYEYLHQIDKAIKIAKSASKKLDG